MARFEEVRRLALDRAPPAPPQQLELQTEDDAKVPGWAERVLAGSLFHMQLSFLLSYATESLHHLNTKPPTIRFSFEVPQKLHGAAQCLFFPAAQPFAPEHKNTRAKGHLVRIPNHFF